MTKITLRPSTPGYGHQIAISSKCKDSVYKFLNLALWSSIAKKSHAFWQTSSINHDVDSVRNEYYEMVEYWGNNDDLIIDIAITIEETFGVKVEIL